MNRSEIISEEQQAVVKEFEETIKAQSYSQHVRDGILAKITTVEKMRDFVNGLKIVDKAVDGVDILEDLTPLADGYDAPPAELLECLNKIMQSTKQSGTYGQKFRSENGINVLFKCLHSLNMRLKVYGQESFLSASYRPEGGKQYPSSEKELTLVEKCIKAVLESIRVLSDATDGLRDMVESQYGIIELIQTLCDTYDETVRDKASFILFALSLLPPRYFAIP